MNEPTVKSKHMTTEEFNANMKSIIYAVGAEGFTIEGCHYPTRAEANLPFLNPADEVSTDKIAPRNTGIKKLIQETSAIRTQPGVSIFKKQPPTDPIKNKRNNGCVCVVAQLEGSPLSEDIKQLQIDLIGPWLEASYSGNINDLYNEIDFLCDEYREENAIAEETSYTAFANSCIKAITMINDSLVALFNLPCIKALLPIMEVVNCKYIGNNTIVLFFVPKT